VQGIREAGIEEIAKVRGFNRASAARLLEALAATSPTAPTQASA
jgi:hypothetical protein